MPANQRRKRSHRRQAFFVLFIILALLAGLGVLQHGISNRGLVTAHFQNPDGSTSRKYSLELALTQADRQRGLMFRQLEDFPENRGMIFIFPDEEVRSFWMRNTYISLDMLFIDGNYRIVGIVHEAPVLTNEQQSVGLPSKYVVELRAGQARAESIVVGSTLVVDELPVAQ